jgi:periplasmic divalent cation tolerance protein
MAQAISKELTLNELIVVLATASSTHEAETLARLVLEARLAACVNLVPGVESMYWWEGKLEHGREVLMVIKTQRALLEPLTAALKSAHSYSVPEVIALPIVGGNPDYLAWVGAETSSDQTTGR